LNPSTLNPKPKTLSSQTLKPSNFTPKIPNPRGAGARAGELDEGGHDIYGPVVVRSTVTAAASPEVEATNAEWADRGHGHWNGNGKGDGDGGRGGDALIAGSGGGGEGGDGGTSSSSSPSTSSTPTVPSRKVVGVLHRTFDPDVALRFTPNATGKGRSLVMKDFEYIYDSLSKVTATNELSPRYELSRTWSTIDRPMNKQVQRKEEKSYRTLRSTPYALCPMPHTLNAYFYTSNPTPYTLHLEP